MAGNSEERPNRSADRVPAHRKPFLVIGHPTHLPTMPESVKQPQSHRRIVCCPLHPRSGTPDLRRRTRPEPSIAWSWRVPTQSARSCSPTPPPVQGLVANNRFLALARLCELHRPACHSPEYPRAPARSSSLTTGVVYRFQATAGPHFRHDIRPSFAAIDFVDESGRRACKNRTMRKCFCRPGCGAFDLAPV